MKNIGIPSEKEYSVEFISSVNQFESRMRWRAYFFLHPDKRPKKKETFQFRSLAAPPPVPELKPLQMGLHNLVKTLKFRKSPGTNSFQQRLRKDSTEIRKETKLIIPADKTSNFYKVEKESYEKILEKNINKNYKKASDDDVKNSRDQHLKLIRDLELEERVFATLPKPAFATLKDHKPDFQNKPTVRLINPYKPQIGKVAKQILDEKLQGLREATGLNQFKNSFSVIEWYKNIPNKERCKFLIFDICDFYSSITEELFSDAISWASDIVDFSAEEIEILKASMQSFLWSKGSPWKKKNNSKFDVGIGSYPGAEACDLVGLYKLSQAQDLGLHIGLFRDDGIALSRLTEKLTEKVKVKLIRIFERDNLKLDIQVNKTVVNYLDLTLDLSTGEYRPYMKDNDHPSYVHRLSNHPPGILRNIPKNINDRLSRISSSEAVFEAAAPVYQEALKSAGYDHKLKFQPPNTNNSSGTGRNRTRSRNITWFNPPFSTSVETQIGKEFMKIIEAFPKNNPLSKLINKNNIKMSYKCMKNMSQVVNSHNSKILKDPAAAVQPHQPHCNCQARHKQDCPLPGQCAVDSEGKVESVIYRCEVTRTDTGVKETYTGLTGGPFKTRWYGHCTDIRNYDKDNPKQGTSLSRYIGKLKSKNIPYSTEWKIVQRAPTFNPTSGSCRLCLLEKWYIMFDPKNATLNDNHELFKSCLHRKRHLLKNS